MTERETLLVGIRMALVAAAFIPFAANVVYCCSKRLREQYPTRWRLLHLIASLEFGIGTLLTTFGNDFWSWMGMAFVLCYIAIQFWIIRHEPSGAPPLAGESGAGQAC
jgi:hypothetical protein